jgi:hypothetical protein
MKLQQNISIFDVLATKNGNINGIIQFICDSNLTTINENLQGVDLDVYTNNSFSQNLKFANRIVCTRDRDLPIYLIGEFNDDYNDDFNNL